VLLLGFIVESKLKFRGIDISLFDGS